MNLDGQKFRVLHCDFRFSQQLDITGKPVAVPLGGSITLQVESTASTEFFDWMISPVMTKSGSITFYRRDTNSKLKTLEFADAHCVSYHEVFDHAGEHPMLVELILSAKSLKLNDSEFKNNWPQ
jgi:hypothetical protein